METARDPRDEGVNPIDAADHANGHINGHAGSHADGHTTGAHDTFDGAADEPLRDLGWGKPSHEPRPQFLDGIDNEEVWMLVRRFNKTIFHVKMNDTLPPGSLDMEVSPEEKFAPNKMRSQIERLYMTVIISAFSFVKHVARLRSWRERNRTTFFCVTYFAAWALDLVAPAVLLLLIALVASPDARRTLFPPLPTSLLPLSFAAPDAAPSKPASGVLATADSLTGAPERHRGETVEREASNAVSALGAVAANVVLGKDPHGEPNEPSEALGPSAPEPDKLATMVATAKDRAEGELRPSGDKSKVAVETGVAAGMRPSMHLITCVCDVWERVENLLSPKPPFHPTFHRNRLAAALSVVFLLSICVSRGFIIRTSTFAFGALLFGDPVIQRASVWLDANLPSWRTYLNINNTLLAGVPTNAQVTLTQLRLAEARNTPIPPPPRPQDGKDTPPSTEIDLSAPHDGHLGASFNDAPLGATDAELRAAAARDESTLEDAGGADHEAGTTAKSPAPTSEKRAGKILSLVRGIVKGSVRAGEGVDRLRAKAGNEGAKNRLGVIPSKSHETASGPVEYDARYMGEKGFLCLVSGTSGPVLAFTKRAPSEALPDGAALAVVVDEKDVRPEWSIPVDRIVELRKHSGYGFKSKLVAGWGVGRRLNDSLGITERGGETYAVTALPRRDELFNRLVAAGTQRWEIW